MKTFLAFLVFLGMSILQLQAQSSNINCATALELPDVVSYCSAEDEFDSEDVGGSEFDAPDCWSAAQNDLWFTFIASNKSINIIVNASQGSMGNPEIALLKGEDCTFLTEISCITNGNTDDITTLFESNVIVGERYYIRVDGRSTGDDGTFQMCIESFNPPIKPGQDCNTASILCSKEPFVVENIEGNGVETNEADGTCLDVGGSSENNSTWFKWTCSVSGTFTLDLVPLVITDDYDFAIFEILDGIEGCNTQIIRCSATDGGDFADCGPNTGLDLTSTDLEEDENCDVGEDGYLRFIDMEAGKSYAMLINNFSDSEAGFSLEFGGTAEFEGPQADFEVDFVQCGPFIQVRDVTIPGVSNIASIEWEFGSEATPPTATGPGPHEVEYDDFGSKNISLRVVSELGCQVFASQEVILDACAYVSDLEFVLDSLRNIGCGEVDNGFIQVSTNLACSNYEFNIDGGPFQSSSSFDNLSSGDHIIGIRDENMCTKDTMFTISEVANFDLNAGDDVTVSTIGMGIQVNAMTDAVGDVTISWSPSDGVQCLDGSTNCLDPIINPDQTTSYTITIIDESGCQRSDELTITVPDFCAGSDLGIQVDSIRGSYCNGIIGSYLQVSGANGAPGYSYSLNGSDFTEDSIFNDLDPGVYNIDIQDQLNCRQSIEVTIEDRPSFTVDAGGDLVTNGTEPFPSLNGSHSAEGGVTISWSPGTGIICPDSVSLNCLNPIVNPTVTTTYTMTITDALGCSVSDQVTVRVERNENIFAPTVFSPNDDGVNDVFSILADPDIVQNIEQLLVFDRWGNRVFEGRNLSIADPNGGWNGLINGVRAEQGVYVWYAEILFFSEDPDNPGEDRKTVKGDVTLIR